MWSFLKVFCILTALTPVIWGTANPCCPANEIYSECGNNGCQNTCANPNIGKVCKGICKSGCICKEGYLRNTKGVCVPAVQCDTCGINEVFDLCGNTGCVNTCAEPDLITRCTPEGCNAGCICREGFLRNAEKKCVRPNECEIGCGGDPNAEFDPCGDSCPVTCENKDSGPRFCAAVCNIDGGCRCKTGFVRDSNGKCIPPEKCPKCSGPNEFFSCGSACDTTCATLGEVCPIVNIKCTEMCYCKEGFARDSNGVCIPVDQCPPKQCPTDPNAIVVPCGDPCPLTCDNKDDKGPRPCAAICIVNGCKCKDGFVKGKDGKCILARNCPVKPPTPTLKCKANEVLEKCPPPCPPEKTCSSYFSGFEPLCPAVIPNPEDCKPACRCKTNYVRNDKGLCVLPAGCCTDPNSELVSCPNPCPGGTCANPEFTPCKRKCDSSGCQCKKGYVKKSDTDPTCVLQTSCCNYPTK